MPSLGPVLIHRADYDRSQPTGEESRPGRPILELQPYGVDLPIYLATASADDVFYSTELRFPRVRMVGYVLPDADILAGDVITVVRDLGGALLPVAAGKLIIISAVIPRAGVYLRVEGDRVA